MTKVIADYIESSKRGRNDLDFIFQYGNHAMSGERIDFEKWMVSGDRTERSETFARAWLDGYEVEK